MYKVGDRIFYECLDGTIGTAIVKDTESRTYMNFDGEIINYNLLRLGSHAAIEDYSCLSKDDERVKEFIKLHKNEFEFEDNFIRWMNDNNYSLKSNLIKETLTELLS